jgi:hypothetical protein
MIALPFAAMIGMMVAYGICVMLPYAFPSFYAGLKPPQCPQSSDETPASVVVVEMAVVDAEPEYGTEFITE